MAHLRLLSTAGILGSACTLALALAPTSALATSSAPQTITVGTLTLKFCDQEFNGYCGSIKRAFDPTGGVKGNINIGFVYYPRFDLDHVQWTEDLEITGTIRWYTASGDVSADVKLRQNGKNIGNLNFAWNDVDVNAVASITGTINRDRVKAKRIAP